MYSIPCTVLRKVDLHILSLIVKINNLKLTVCQLSDTLLHYITTFSILETLTHNFKEVLLL